MAGPPVLKGRSIQDLSSVELGKILTDLSKYDPQQDPVVRARRFHQLQLFGQALTVSVGASCGSGKQAERWAVERRSSADC